MRFFCFHKKLYRSNPNTPDELKICIRAARKELKYGIPILKVKNYTLEDIFERRLWMLIPFYIFRYEKELSQIDSDEERLEKLRREYERVAEMLDQECKNGRMRSVTGGALCELSRTVVEKLASKYKNVEKEVAEVMGVKVLTLSGSSGESNRTRTRTRNRQRYCKRACKPCSGQIPAGRERREDCR